MAMILTDIKYTDGQRIIKTRRGVNPPKTGTNKISAFSLSVLIKKKCNLKHGRFCSIDITVDIKTIKWSKLSVLILPASLACQHGSSHQRLCFFNNAGDCTSKQCRSLDFIIELTFSGPIGPMLGNEYSIMILIIII